MVQKKFFWYLSAFVLGVMYVFAFAPFKFYLLIYPSLGLLFWLWLKAENLSEAFWLGWAFGMGQFGIGVSWMYVSLTTFGGMPSVLAGLAVLLLIMGLSVFPALVGLIQQLFKQTTVSIQTIFIISPLWVALEWVREWIFTGLPWLSAGYSHTESLISMWAPIGGVYLVSLIVVLLVSAIICLISANKRSAISVAVLIVLGTYFIHNKQWTIENQQSLSVKLVQGNISIWDKWNIKKADEILQKYLGLSEQGQPTDLIIWPEAAAPLLMKQLPNYFLDAIKTKNNTYTMFGVVERDTQTGDYYNSVATNQSDGSFSFYRKIHLVPFGEFLPFKPLLQWIINYLSIPMSDFTGYDPEQPAINVKGIKIGVSICYEDAFANVIRASLPQAQLLVNISEDAWFGNSLAPHQRLQMAQMRAIENARTLIRVSNNGLSSIINYKGEILKLAPQFESYVFDGMAQVRNGATPFSLFGHKLVLSLISGLILIALLYAIVNKNTR